MRYLMLSLLITFGSFAYSYESDYGFNQANKVVKVSQGLYKTDVDGLCADGFTEGVKINRSVGDYRECLNTNWVSGQNKYRTDVDGKCVEGFIEGMKLKYKADYDAKECLNTKWVSKQNLYKTYVGAKCAEGFVEERKINRWFDYGYKECRRVK